MDIHKHQRPRSFKKIGQRNISYLAERIYNMIPEKRDFPHKSFIKRAKVWRLETGRQFFRNLDNQTTLQSKLDHKRLTVMMM